jgi:CheY-like chemotaxis protein
VDTCHNLSDILTDLGYEVDVAHDGLAALDKVRTRPHDVALLDLKMPGMDGLTLYREIRKLRAGTVAIIVTAYSSEATSQEADTAGVWQVVPKPVDPARLLSLVEKVLGQPLVLIVDDDRELCTTLWDLLRERGYRVCIAHGLNEAAQRLDRPFEVVLIDIRLPDGDGRQVHDLVREACPETRTLLITAYRSEMDRLVDQLLAEGANAACYKPFDVPQLLSTLQKLSADRKAG